MYTSGKSAEKVRTKLSCSLFLGNFFAHFDETTRKTCWDFWGVVVWWVASKSRPICCHQG